MEFDASSLFFGIIFGIVGVGAFQYGRNTHSGRHMILGLLLMAYPYFIPGAWLTFLIGALLTSLLFWPPL